MQSLQDLRIGARLGLGFAVVIVAGLAVASYAKLALGGVTDEIKALTGQHVVTVGELTALKDGLNVVASATRNLVLTNDATQIAAEKARIDTARADIAAHRDRLAAEVQGEKARALLADLDSALKAYRAAMDKAIDLGQAKKDDEAREQLLGQTKLRQDAAFAALDKLIGFERDLMAQSGATAAATADRAGAVMLGVAVLAGLIGAFVAWAVARSVTRPIGAAIDIADRIRAGDLTQEVEVTSRDETGRLLLALREMQRSLAGVVGNVRQNAESVATASAQIAHGNQDLSQRTEEQASSLQQTAASMEQLGSTVKQNADNARQANQLALGASTVAVKGGEVVSEVIETMKGINDSSKKIADIIGVIDSIAFQTNILALNAAVEAARAGEQGRGFAVVASEVRSLAGRSAEAAKEIKSLITASVERVEQGAALVDQAGATMTEVVGSIRRVTDIMGEISAASNEQSTGVAQVGEAVGQMDRVTQQNAALVEQSAAAADSLKTQAQQLLQAVSAFKLGPDGTHLATAAPAVERRSPQRATNVARPAFGAGPARPARRPQPVPAPTLVAETSMPKTGTEDWETF